MPRQFVFVSVFVFVSLSAAWLLDRGRGSRCQNNRLAFDWHLRESPAPSARDWFQATKHFLLSWPIITCGHLIYKYLFTILPTSIYLQSYSSTLIPSSQCQRFLPNYHTLHNITVYEKQTNFPCISWTFLGMFVSTRIFVNLS